MSKEIETTIIIDFCHHHCLYCGAMLLPGKGYGDFTVTPAEIACNKKHLDKYRRKKQTLKGEQNEQRSD